MSASRFTSLRRRAGWDRNPLRRAEDRVQSVVAALLLLLFMIVGPFAAFVVAERVYAYGLTAERHDRAVLHRVEAPAKAGSREPGDAAWTMTRWADEQGRPARPPREHVSTIAQSSAAGVSALAVTAGLLWCTHASVRHGLDRSRYRHWESDWTAAETRWRRRA